MKHLKKRLTALVLAGAMLLGLGASSLAAGTSFSDVPESHWAYADVEAAASAGLMNGTGNGGFSPDMKVSAAQFLTLVGRVVFPEVKAEGADWYGPYVSVAQSMGLLDGTRVDVDDLGAEITRYDMAAILQAAAKVMGVNDQTATQSDVADYMDIPNRYTQAVLAVYGMGLIRGDQNGKFNGANTMTRAEVAVVVNRLAKVQTQGATYRIEVRYTAEPPQGVLVVGESTYVKDWADPWSETPYKMSHNLTGFSCTSSNTDVVEVSGTSDARWIITAKSVGTATITVTDPYGVSGSREVAVVAQRENMGTITKTVQVWVPHYETHTFRGNAYTKKTYLSAVPYEIRYTRDDGKTFQVVYEGVSRAFEDGESWTSEKQEIELEFPEDAFYSINSSFYVSIDTVVDGQRWVTPDRRTDGRDEIYARSRRWDDTAVFSSLLLTPPDGEKLPFVFDGQLQFYHQRENRYEPVANASVQLQTEGGIVVGETVTDASGSFVMDCAIDVRDVDWFAPAEKTKFTVVMSWEADGEIKTETVRNQAFYQLYILTQFNKEDTKIWDKDIVLK